VREEGEAPGHEGEEVGREGQVPQVRHKDGVVVPEEAGEEQGR